MAHKWARWLHNPCHLGGSPPLQSGGQNHRWPTSGQGGYITPAARGVPHHFRVGGTITGGPQVGKVATSPLPPEGVPTASEWAAKLEVAHKWARWLHNPCYLGGSPPLQSGGGKQRWPTSGQGGYITPATWGGLHRFRVGRRIRSGPQVGRWLHNPCRLGGSPPLQSRGQNQRWPTSGQGG